MTQSGEGPALGFGSVYDLKVVASSPTLGSTLSVNSASDALFLPSVPPTLCLSQMNK